MLLIKKIFSLAVGSLAVATTSAFVSFLSRSKSQKEEPAKSAQTQSGSEIPASSSSGDLSFGCCAEDIWF